MRVEGMREERVMEPRREEGNPECTHMDASFPLENSSLPPRSWTTESPSSHVETWRPSQPPPRSWASPDCSTTLSIPPAQVPNSPPAQEGLYWAPISNSAAVVLVRSLWSPVFMLMTRKGPGNWNPASQSAQLAHLPGIILSVIFSFTGSGKCCDRDMLFGLR